MGAGAAVESAGVGRPEDDVFRDERDELFAAAHPTRAALGDVAAGDNLARERQEAVRADTRRVDLVLGAESLRLLERQPRRRPGVPGVTDSEQAVPVAGVVVSTPVPHPGSEYDEDLFRRVRRGLCPELGLSRLGGPDLGGHQAAGDASGIRVLDEPVPGIVRTLPPQGKRNATLAGRRPFRRLESGKSRAGNFLPTSRAGDGRRVSDGDDAAFATSPLLADDDGGNRNSRALQGEDVDFGAFTDCAGRNREHAIY